MNNFIKEELSGWHWLELLWLFSACAVITGLSIFWGDNAAGIISALSGVACVVLTGKGKLSAYIFGLVNSLLYALISFRAAYYGEVMLNLIYYVPMQFYGFFVWKKNYNTETHEVHKRRMTLKVRLISLISIALGTVFYGLLLKRLGGQLPYVDSLSTVSSVAAMLISVKMYMEQWIIWIVVDVVTVFMWGKAYADGSGSMATLLMWTVYLANAVIMYIKWRKESDGNG